MLLYLQIKWIYAHFFMWEKKKDYFIVFQSYCMLLGGRLANIFNVCENEDAMEIVQRQCK